MTTPSEFDVRDDWEAVFWDVGGVILDVESVRTGHRRFVEGFVADRGLDASPEAALETWRSAVGDHFRTRDGTEFRSAREGYAKGIAAVVGEDIPDEEWLPAFREAVNAVLSPNPGAVETVRRLAETDLHLGVISDVDTAEGRHILEAFGLFESFDSFTTSEAIGRTKPDPAMFETALEAADVDAGRSLMVGDRYEHDVAGGKRAGMRTAAYGADDGPAVDYRLDRLTDVLTIVGADGATSR